MIKSLLFVLCILISNNVFAARIIQVNTGKEISEIQLFQALQQSPNIILGEKHYTPNVQIAEANIIQGVIGNTSRNFSLGWEFLNVSSRSKIDEQYSQLINGKISSLEFLNNNLGNYSENHNYVPVLEVLIKLNGSIFPLNLSRLEKAPVVQNGISAADPKLIPNGFALGDANYLERFTATMQGHVESAAIANYFQAQCLVDDVMATQFINNTQTNLKFMIAGSFHTDYFSGTVARLRIREPNQKMLVVKITDELDDPVDPKYGEIADFIYFVNI